jgi:hypothetical protein
VDELVHLTAGISRGSPSTPEEVARIGRALEFTWPEDFAAFLAESGGGEGWVGESYLVVWPPDEIEATNEELMLRKFAPTLVGFGSDGGGELFAFDKSQAPPRIVMVPLIGLDQPVDVGPDFGSFLRRLQSGELFGE